MEGLVAHLLTSLHNITTSAGGLWDFLPTAWWPVAIFLLRTADQTAATVRTLVINQGDREFAWPLGFVQAILFLLGVAGVFAQLENPWNVIAFAAGYGAGSVVGVTVENWMAPGHAILRIVSKGQGPALVEALRTSGRGVTELPGQGRHGTVTVLLSTVPRRQVGLTRDTLLAVDPEAFVTVENVRILQGGWVL